MKWIVYVLVVANCALFAWQASRGPRPAMPALASGSEYPSRLLRIAEIDPAELRPRVRVEAGEPQPVPDERDAAPPTAEGAASGHCYGVGPLSGEEEIDRMRVWLEEEGATTRLRVDERREVALYWIYFPPFADPDAARERVAEMKAKGLEDISVIQRGDMANAVSLGVYSRQESLERRLRELEAQGYEPAVAPRYRTEKAAWYDVAFPPGAEFPAERFALAFPSAQVSEAACPSSQTALRPSGLPSRASGEGGRASQLGGGQAAQ